MKKIGIIIFIVAIGIGVIVANFFSFGNSIIKSPFKAPISLSFSFGKVKGSGNVITEKRDVSDFKNVKVGGIFKVEIVAQKDFGVEIDADDNIVPLIKTEVRGNTLKITRKKRFSSKSPIKIRVYAPNIEKLDVSGVSNTKLSNLENESLKIEISGASKVSIEGKTNHFKVEMSGASKVDANELKSSNVKVEGSGASKAYVNVSDSLNAELSGASKVRYSGNPTNIDRKTSGASNLEQSK